VALVTADPRDRQLIEKLEERQYPKSNHKTLSNDWFGYQPYVAKDFNDSKRKSRHFLIDESRIEYNGWKPVRGKEEKSIDTEESGTQKEELMDMQLSSGSEPIPAIVPIIGRVSDNWKVA